jgi:hypothetical protein
MKYLKLFEAFTGGGLSSTPPQTLEEQIAFSLKWYPRLYDSKWGRMKVLDHMYLGYGTEYEWEGGKLINFDQNNNDYDMYEYRYRVWQSRKKENEERLNREMDHYENMCGIFDRTINKPGTTEEEKAEGRKYLKRIQDDINKIQDEIDNFDPYGKEYPDEKPLDCNKLHYSNYSPIFNLPEDITPEYLEGAKEIVKYIMDHTTNDKVWNDFEPIAKKLNVI